MVRYLCGTVGVCSRLKYHTTVHMRYDTVRGLFSSTARLGQVQNAHTELRESLYTAVWHTVNRQSTVYTGKVRHGTACDTVQIRVKYGNTPEYMVQTVVNWFLKNYLEEFFFTVNKYGTW